MKAKKGIITCLVLLFSLATCLLPIGRLLIPKTPKGVDVSPVMGLYFFGNVNVYRNLEKKFGDQISNKEYRDNNEDAFIFPGRTNRAVKSPYCGVTIYQFPSNDKAFEKYNKYKDMFTDDSYEVLYDEEGKEGDRYFITYETPHGDYHRAIPIPLGIISKPHIVIGFQKNNLFIVVSYNSYGNHKNYIKEINEGIAYAAYLLKNSAVDGVDINQEQKDR